MKVCVLLAIALATLKPNPQIVVKCVTARTVSGSGFKNASKWFLIASLTSGAFAYSGANVSMSACARSNRL